MTCPACGSPVPAGARYCSSCGHELHARADERRVATVLFADIVGFTGLSEAEDPERIKALLDQCFSELVAVVTSFGGRVDKIVGDAVVALFGAPVAHEDDAERAVRAALRMQQVVERLAGELGATLRLRVGVNTGEVIVGAMRAGGDYTALGDAVNVASRLQTAAAPGEVLVGPSTEAAVRDAIELEPRGLLQARGREEPVEVWVARRAVAPPGRRARPARAPLVGRDAELALLHATLADVAIRGRSQLVLLVGEAGVGKSRLAEELARLATTEHEARVLEGRCVPYGEANPWWPVAEVLRQAFDLDAVADADPAVVEERVRRLVAESAQGCDEAELERIADGLLHLLGAETPLAQVEPGRAREQAVRAVGTFADQMAARRPLVVVLSELHWASTGVLDLVDQLLERLRHRPLLVIGTARPELEDRWTPRAGRHGLVVLPLEPLGEEAAGHLLDALLASDADPALRRTLLERAGGNPLFLEELVSLLDDAGVLQGHPAAAGAARRVDGLPATLRGLVAARLDALPDAARAMFDDAAVMGRAGSVAGLVALAQARGDADPARALEDLVDRDLLQVDGESCTIRSELLREVAYGTLSKAERARRHAAVGGWLEGVREADRAPAGIARTAELLEALAHHYGTAAELAAELAGPDGTIDGVPADIRRRALAVVERAAARAEGRETLSFSARLFDQALRLAEGVPEEDAARRRLLVGRGRVRVTLRDLDGAVADLEAALAAADAAGDDRTAAAALAVLGDAQQKAGHHDRSDATLGEAVARFRAAGDRAGESGALRTRSLTALFAGRLDDARALAEAALGAARESGERRVEAWALQNIAWVAFERGANADARRWLLESAAAFRDLGDFGGLSWANGLRGWVELYLGDLDAAVALAESVRDEARVQGDRWGLGMMVLLLSSAHLWQGQVAQSAAEASEALRLFESAGDAWGRVQALSTRARAAALQGRVRDALASVDAAAALLAGVSTRAGREGTLLVGAATPVALGLPERALEAMERDAGLVGERGSLGASEAAILGAVAHLQLGELAEADRRLDHADGLAERGGETGRLAWSATVRALVRCAQGRPEEALAVLDARSARSSPSFSDRAQAGVAAGTAQLQLGDPSAARASFDRAEEAADATDAVLEQALVRLARAHAAVAAGDAAGAALLEDARRRLAGLGAPVPGWETAYRLAAAPIASLSRP